MARSVPYCSGLSLSNLFGNLMGDSYLPVWQFANRVSSSNYSSTQTKPSFLAPRKGKKRCNSGWPKLVHFDSRYLCVGVRRTPETIDFGFLYISSSYFLYACFNLYIYIYIFYHQFVPRVWQSKLLKEENLSKELSKVSLLPFLA